MDMRVISADSHMMEPADLWETRLDQQISRPIAESDQERER